MRALTTVVKGLTDNYGQIRLSKKQKNSSSNKMPCEQTYQAIIILWTRLDQLFSPQWRNANGELGGDNFNYVCELLANKTPEEIQAGIVKLENSGSEFKPTLPELKRICRIGRKHPSHAMIGVDFQLPDYSVGAKEPSKSFFDMKEKLRKIEEENND